VRSFPFTAQCCLENPPLLESAIFSISTQLATLTFTKDIDVASDVRSNLSFRFGGSLRRFDGTETIVGPVVSGPTVVYATEGGAPIVTYSGYPLDILGTCGLPVADFIRVLGTIA